jgi:hypothetical protein
MNETLLARVEHSTDWHAFITDPRRGELGYCLEHGGDELDEHDQPIGDPWSPTTATAVLARAGWQVVGTWRDSPPDADHQYEADVRPAT